MSTPPVIVRVTGRLGRIVLNRPRAINALTSEMVDIVHDTLDLWGESPRVRNIIISGSGGRGLCAGGDIRAIHADAVSGGSSSLDFWRREYRLNARIADYPKPIIAWMDGLVMGGGIGIAGHASHRVVTERAKLAMPEVGIGFHPDVGGSWLLGRAPGEVGTHLALTGTQIDAADAIASGLADDFVPSRRFAHLLTQLSVHNANPAIAMLAEAAPEAGLSHQRKWIDSCYGADTVGEILERLRAHPDAAAMAAAEEIATKSPTSLAVALRSIRSARRLPHLQSALKQEYRLSKAMLRSPDLAEGIRAQIIDKDRCPRWSPSDISAVSESFIDKFFAPTDGEPALASEAAQ